MSMIIAHNMSAVNTVRNFSISSRGMSSAMEKLSSGYKINTGKDDPSGLMISEKLRAQEVGLQRAKQNTEEAINVIGIAEGALNETNNILKKMKQLAVHAASDGVTSPEQIAADQAELDSSIQTIDRIARTTKYANQPLLSGGKAISFDSDTIIQGTQNNQLLDANSSHIDQIFRRNNYAVSIGFTGTKNADQTTAIGDVDFSKQAMKAYLEVDSARGSLSQVDENGNFTQTQSFILTGSKGSRSFTFDKGTPVSEMVSQIHNTAGSTGVDASLVFNSDQRIEKTVFPYRPPEPDPIVNEPIRIDEMHNSDGDPVTMDFSMYGIPANNLKRALEEAGLTGFTFRLEADDLAARTLKLIATDSQNHDYTVLTGWDGSELGGRMAGTVTTVDGDPAVAQAMGQMRFHTSDALVPEMSVMPTTLDYDFESFTGIKTIADNIYNSTAYSGGAYNGQGEIKVDLDNLNWGGMFATLSESEKKEFLRAAQNGELAFNMVIDPAVDQAAFQPRFQILDTARPGTAFFDQTYSRAASGINAKGVTNGQVTLGGLFSGLKWELSDSKENIGYRPANSVNTGNINTENTNVGTPTVAATNQVVGSYNLPAGLSAGFATPAGNLKQSDGSAVQFTFSSATGATTDDLNNALIALCGSKQFTLGVETSAASLGNASAELYLLSADNTRYSLGTWSSAGVFTKNVSPLDAVGTALNAFTISAPAFDQGKTFTATNGFNYSFTTSNVSYTAATRLYGTTPAEGKLDLAINNINWDSIYAGLSNTDKQHFLDAVRGTGFQIIMDPGSGTQGSFSPTFKLVSQANNAIIFGQQTFTNIDRDTGLANANFTMFGGNATLTLTDIKDNYGYQGGGNTISNSNVAANVHSKLIGSLNLASTSLTSPQVLFGPSIVYTAQHGGVTFNGANALREIGSPAVFNNVIDENGSGRVLQGVNGADFVDSDKYNPPPGAASIQYGLNTDGQGRIYVKFTGDQSFELYKDASLSPESLVGSGISGQEVSERNNSGLEGLIIHLMGENLQDVHGVYMTFAGVEGESYVPPPIDKNGVVYNGDVIGNDGALDDNGRGTMQFDAARTLITGINLGQNTSSDGKIYTKSVYNAEDNTVQVFAYKDEQMRDEDLVAKSQPYITRTPNHSFNPTLPEGAGNLRWTDVTSMTVVLSEIRNDDNTFGTGLGIVLSMSGPAFRGAESSTLNGSITFTNLGARVFAEEYGSDHFVKVNQTTGGIFTYYGNPGDANSQTLIDAGSTGKTVQINGQDATVSLNGMQVTSKGLDLNVATQDLQVRLKLQEGKVGSTTVAQVGYGEGSIFTKIGALTLGSAEENEDGLSGLLCNAGHVTTERMDNFQNGMQLQLGESSGDQDRTVLSIQSMTMDALGRITKGGYWEAGAGKSIYSERVFTLQDVLAGGKASLTGDALLAMEIIEKSIDDVTGLRARLGAVQSNLLQTNSNNLDIIIENIQKTESGIRDADMAVSMSEFTKNQVLQGAGSAMLSQVKQMSQNVLQLLQ